jgi:HAD superfamily hydrolase (TIGR01509 family)
MRRYRGVLLDVDGTLIDSVEAHALAWHQAFADYGHEVRLIAIRRLIGMGGDHLVEQLTGVRKDTREFKAMSKRHGELFRSQYLPKLGPIVGARDLVLQLNRTGYHVAIASSAKRGDLDQLLAAANVLDLIEHRATSDDAERSKPDPDIVEAAAAKLPCSRYELVMIGDTPYDIEAARRAGVDTIAVASGGFAAEELAGAVARYSTVAELLARWDTSPLGESA